jgi:hypothetical protein
VLIGPLDLGRAMDDNDHLAELLKIMRRNIRYYETRAGWAKDDAERRAAEAVRRRWEGRLRAVEGLMRRVGAGAC